MSTIRLFSEMRVDIQQCISRDVTFKTAQFTSLYNNTLLYVLTLCSITHHATYAVTVSL